MRRGALFLLAGWLAVVVMASPTTAKTSKLPKVVRAYMTALARTTPAGATTMERLSAPGSNVAVYSRSFAGVVQAAIDAGQPQSPSPVKFNDKKGTSTICGGKTCIVFSHFKVSSGRVADFLRNGASFAGLLSAGDGSTHDALGSTLSVIGAYQPGPSNLLVSVSVKNGPNQLNFSYVGTYIGPGGHQVQSPTVFAPGADLRPRSSATIAFVFPGAAPGGSVIVKCANEAPLETAETEMPVPVYQPT